MPQKPITVEAEPITSLVWVAARYTVISIGTLAALRHRVDPSLIEPTVGALAASGAVLWGLGREFRNWRRLVRLADALPDSLAVVRRPGYDGGVNPITADTSPRRDQPEMDVIQNQGGSSQTASLAPVTETPVTTAGSDTAADQAAANHAAALTAVAPVLATAAVQQSGGTFGSAALSAFSAMLTAAEANLATIFAVTRSSATTQLEVEGGAVVLNAAVAGLQALQASSR